jgi:tetratricopeptide (TPR) repeat protein
MADQAVAMARRTGRANGLNSALQSRLLIETHAPDAEAMLRDAQEIVAAPPEHIGPMWSDRLFAMRQLPVALVRLGRRDDAERQLAIVVSEAEQSGLRISIQNALLFRSALATASGRFAESKAVAAEAAQRAGSHTMIVELAYAAQIVNGRMEQGRLDAVIAGLGAALDSPEFELPGYRAMLAGALAEDARFDEALYELDRLGGAAPTSDTERLIGHTPMAIRYVSEVCRRLFDQERATKLLAHVTPWAGQILVSQWGLSIEGAADRAVGHLLSTLGRFDDADTAYAAAAELERAADSHRSSPALSTGTPEPSSIGMLRGIENALVRFSTTSST